MVLEAMAFGVPVLVNGESEVLKAHCIKSSAGVYYESDKELEENFKLLSEEGGQRERFKTLGKNYIKHYYNWNLIMECFEQLCEESCIFSKS